MTPEFVKRYRAAIEDIYGVVARAGRSLEPEVVLIKMGALGYTNEEARRALWACMDPEMDGRIVLTRRRKIRVRRGPDDRYEDDDEGS